MCNHVFLKNAGILLVTGLMALTLGCQPVEVEVPDVVGMTIGEATRGVQEAGLVVSDISLRHDGEKPSRQIAGQTPTAKTTVKHGDSVDLIMSAGAPEGSGEELILTLPGDVPLTLVRIPAGSFLMGSPGTERGRFDSESPMHPVTIGYEYYLGKYPVTQAQWFAMMGTWPDRGLSSRHGIGDEYPVYAVTWHESYAFIKAFNTHIVQTGQGPVTLRLPSEAEWEYACRAGTQTRFHFGNSLSIGDQCADDGIRGKYMWFCANTLNYDQPEPGMRPVGQKLPNAFGVFDMHGNVWEWCEDDLFADYRGAPADGSARVRTPRDTSRAIRGGRWDLDARTCRSARRYFAGADVGNSIVGIRLAGETR